MALTPPSPYMPFAFLKHTRFLPYRTCRTVAFPAFTTDMGTFETAAGPYSTLPTSTRLQALCRRWCLAGAWLPWLLRAFSTTPAWNAQAVWKAPNKL